MTRRNASTRSATFSTSRPQGSGPGRVLHSGPPNKQEVSRNRADAREVRGRRTSVPGVATPDKENKPMLNNDTDLDIPASEDLLAEIGLDAHTIREILADAAPSGAAGEGE